MEPESELLSDRPVRLPREPELDLHEAEARPREGRRARRGWWAVVVLALVAGTVVVYADGRVRSREAEAVAVCESRLRLASDHADYRMGLTTNYVRPTASEGGARTHLADLMAPRARRVLPAVQRADRICKAVSVRPWHFSLVSRQNAATAYSGALVTLLQIVAAQGRRGFQDTETLLRLRNAAGLSGG
jgi:hypothetical protein